MRKLFSGLVLLVVFGWLGGCDKDAMPTKVQNSEQVEILFGMGNEIPMARETPLYREAPVNMISSWFSKPEDLEWMRYYPERNTLSTLYGKGYAQELIIWLHDYPQYAISDDFQEDLKEMIEIFKGEGPERGPLYVVLFTEFETYSDDPEYYIQLKEAFMDSRETIKGVYEGANVAIGFGGYGWSGIEERELKDWEEEVLMAGDFAAVQAHHHVSNMDLMIPQVRNSIEQLGSYGKPVMLSHFRIWKRDGEGGLSTEEAFRRFIMEMHTEESMTAMAEDGLFAWNFFWDDFINEPGAAYNAIQDVVRTFGSEKTALSDYK